MIDIICPTTIIVNFEEAYTYKIENGISLFKKKLKNE